MTFLPLDHRIFGNGYGMGTPYCDGTFYWLDGEMYHWSGWFGSQLASYQWSHPNAGEERKLAGVKFRPFHSERRWGRVRVSWAAQGMPHGLNEQNAWLRALKQHLGAGYHTFDFVPPAQGTSASGQDPEGLEAKPAGPVAEGNAPKTNQDNTPNGESHD